MTDHTSKTPIRRALISVSDKTGIVEFAQALDALGVEILSTGGTFKLLKDNAIPAIEVADYTGFAEMMDGRVKTLHPKIHGGILGRRDIDAAIMDEHGIKPIDLVAVNLYPFAATVAKADCTLPDAIENIDIGGPTMVRSAAKNHKDVAIVVNSSDYNEIIEGLKQGGLSYAQRFNLALKAFEHTAAYDGMIANYLGTIDQSAETLSTEQRKAFPNTFNTQFIKAQDMRYGENPHQTAAFYLLQRSWARRQRRQHRGLPARRAGRRWGPPWFPRQWAPALEWQWCNRTGQRAAGQRLPPSPTFEF